MLLSTLNHRAQTAEVHGLSRGWWDAAPGGNHGTDLGMSAMPRCEHQHLRPPRRAAGLGKCMGREGKHQHCVTARCCAVRGRPCPLGCGCPPRGLEPSLWVPARCHRWTAAPATMSGPFRPTTGFNSSASLSLPRLPNAFYFSTCPLGPSL